MKTFMFFHSRLYWTDHGVLPDVGASIESCNLDGSNRSVLVGRGVGLGQPNHMYIDFKTDW